MCRVACGVQIHMPHRDDMRMTGKEMRIGICNSAGRASAAGSIPGRVPILAEIRSCQFLIIIIPGRFHQLIFNAGDTSNVTVCILMFSGSHENESARRIPKSAILNFGILNVASFSATPKTAE